MKEKLILVIDDNEETCEQVKSILELEDYQVHIAHRGQNGLEQVFEGSFQLILCALVLPDMSGYEVLKALSMRPETSGIPVVLMSDEDDIRSFRDAMSNGAVDYLTKPFKGEDILNIVDIRIHRQEAISKINNETSELSNDLSTEWKNISQDHEFFRNKKIKILKAREVLFREGDFGTTVYYILSGKINTYKSTDCGRIFLMDICTQGDFIGYSIVFSSNFFQESAVAQEDAQVITISKSDFIDFLYRDKNVLQKFVRELSRKIHQSERQLIKLAYDSARKRVSDAILFIFGKYNKNNTLNTPVPFSRSILSSLAAVSNECVSRNLTDFRNEGLIRLNKRGLFVLDFDKLKNIRS